MLDVTQLLDKSKAIAKAAITALATCFTTACSNGIEIQSVTPDDIQHDMVFEQDGTTYAVTAGNFYEKKGSNWKFVEKIYDPDYRSMFSQDETGNWLLFDEESGTSYKTTTEFSANFENADTIEDLIGEQSWHSYSTDPRKAGRKDNYYDTGNRITISQDVVHSGTSALKFSAMPDSHDVSKASVRRGLQHFVKGDHLYFSGWYFIEPTPDLYSAGAFTILDIESSYIRYFGFRLKFRKNGSLSLETKLPKRTFEQDIAKAVPFPQSQWVHLNLHVLLDEKNGMAELWQDGQKVLDMRGQTLSFADMIIDNLELGVTVIAKGSKHSKVVYVDDVQLSASPIPLPKI